MPDLAPTLNIKNQLHTLTTPWVMGILNATPDSFFAGSRFAQSENALRRAEQILQEGGKVIDVGGYSSRPQAEDIDAAIEKSRVLPIIELINRQFPEAILSIDTFRASVAEAALEVGANIVNDISGGNLDAQMFATVSRWQVPYILMHMRGTPQTMTQLTDYEDIIKEIMGDLQQKIQQLRALGQKDIILDIGFGFAKNIQQNFFLLKNLSLFQVFNLPILVGISRKSLIYKTLQISSEEALNGTTVLNTIALLQQARILRVHDVRAAVEAVKLVEATWQQ
ncbi:MAG: dihydropteroate synthase [Microscillaceae bacterium]|jgi:dihydropteroate synthase|nr:dihydropteroate synthase [Microscillaceae bacterium]